MLVFNWVREIWKIVGPRYKNAIHHADNALDEVGMLAMNFRQYYRKWNTLADELTHLARETGSSWSYEGRLAASRVLFDGAVNSAWMGYADVDAWELGQDPM